MNPTTSSQSLGAAPRCGWSSDYPTIRGSAPEAIIVSLQTFLKETNPAQVTSWKDSVPILQRETGVVIDAFDAARQFSAVLEYELPREGGRRPDVVALQNGVVVVIEFKEWGTAQPAHLDQVDAYARDLKNYHELSHDLEVIPVLVPTDYRGSTEQIGNVWVLRPSELGSFLLLQARRQTGKLIDARAWVDAEYIPLPSLVTAARMLFHSQALPRIKRAHSARIPDVVDSILAICHEAAATQTRHVIFVVGAPGSGKTLVGLQVAHSGKLDDLRVTRGGSAQRAGAPAVFLSGNGPLVEVLQNALGSRAFVDGMKKFIENYAFKRPHHVPREHVLIFDEAQRAWDQKQMRQKHGQEISESQALLSIAGRIPGWSVVVALIGEGQEIHKGEEAGIAGWCDAIALTSSSQKWTVHAPRRLQDTFSTTGHTFVTDDLLNLTASLRSHVANSVHTWIVELLRSDGTNLSGLRALSRELREASFPIYVTRDIEAAKKYARSRYRDAPQARFGLLASRYAKNLRPLGVDNTYHFPRAEQLKVGPWFNETPSHPLSCCALERPATEFECQGLELDWPIICWGDDFLWDTNQWWINPKQRTTVNNPVAVTKNAYRVLLSRGRDGFCIFVPANPDARFDVTYRLLVAAGCSVLEKE